MKITRLCGLVTLAVIAVLIFSVPAQALDHPWDGTKVADTTNLSNGMGGDREPTGGTDGGEGIAPGQDWFSLFTGWISGIFSIEKVENVDRLSEPEAVEKKSEGKEEPLKKFYRK
jgi:hypothetical protein